MVTRIKMCGMTRRADAEYALGLGVHALGMVREPSSPRYVDTVPDWWVALAPYVVRVAVYGPFHGESRHDAFDRFQAVEWPVHPAHRFKSIAVRRLGPGSTVEEALSGLHEESALLLDALSSTGYGGTGRTVDWGLAAEIRAASRLPVILAGGLTPGNVGDAVRAVRPYAVDVASGIEESPGVKDRSLMLAFVEAVRDAV